MDFTGARISHYILILKSREILSVISFFVCISPSCFNNEVFSTHISVIHRTSRKAFVKLENHGAHFYFSSSFTATLLWNHMKLKITPIVLGKCSSKANFIESCKGTSTTSISSPSSGWPPPSPVFI